MNKITTSICLSLSLLIGTPRLGYAGTYDDYWYNEIFPLLPKDFDERFFQCVPEDQQIPFPKGGEIVEFMCLHPQHSHISFELPSLEIPVVLKDKQANLHQLASVIDTLQETIHKLKIFITTYYQNFMRILKMLRTYLNGVKLILHTFILSSSVSCNGSPSHVLAIKGELNVNVIEDGVICFSPKFSSATFADEPYNNLKGIKNIYINIPSKWGAHIKDDLKVIKDNEELCITENNFNFKKPLYEMLRHDNYYKLALDGLTKDGHQRVIFRKEFYYP